MSPRRPALALLALASTLASCAEHATEPTSSLSPSAGPRWITYGEIDPGNLYPNVGAFIVKSPTTGQIFPICSGTLISSSGLVNAAPVFLTAGHCTEFYLEDLAPLGFTAFVSFSTPIGFGAKTGQPPALLIPVDQAITNPDFSQRQGDSGDLGVLILPVGSTGTITPAALPTLNLLEQLNAKNGLRDAVFNPVGYGVQERAVGGGPPFFIDSNPVDRRYAFSSFNALNKGYLRLSQNPSTGNGGACYGDSGGPNFLTVNGQQTLVAITVTGDVPCRSTNVVYRLDTESARTFLGQYVALP